MRKSPRLVWGLRAPRSKPACSPFLPVRNYGASPPGTGAARSAYVLLGRREKIKKQAKERARRLSLQEVLSRECSWRAGRVFGWLG